MFDFAFFIGALVPTFLISRLLISLGRRLMRTGPTLVVLANVASLVIAGLVLWSFDSFRDIWSDVAAQAVWLMVDLVRMRNQPAEISN